MKTIIEYRDTVIVPQRNYEDAFGIKIDIQINQPNTMITDEEYKKVIDGIKKIRSALSPYQIKASNALINYNERQKSEHNKTK